MVQIQQAQKGKLIPFGIGEGGIEYVVEYAGRLYHGRPLDALKEYVANSIDNALPGKQVTLTIVRHGNTLDLIDDAQGMSYETVESIPQRLWTSPGASQLDKFGKFQLGLFAFRTFVDPEHGALHLYSRTAHMPEGQLNVLHMESRNRKYSRVQKYHDFDLAGLIGESGTFVRFEHLKDTAQKRFKTRSLGEYLQRQFLPLLFAKELHIRSAHYREGGKALRIEDTVEAPLLGVHTIVDETVELPPVEGQQRYLRIYIRGDPGDDKGIVGLFNNGGFLSPAVALEPFDKVPWTLGQLVGFINTNALKPAVNLDKASYELGGAELELVIAEIKKFESRLTEACDQYPSRKRSSEEKLAEHVLKEVLDVMYDLRLPLRRYRKRAVQEPKEPEKEPEQEEEQETTIADLLADEETPEPKTPEPKPRKKHRPVPKFGIAWRYLGEDGPFVDMDPMRKILFNKDRPEFKERFEQGTSREKRDYVRELYIAELSRYAAQRGAERGIIPDEPEAVLAAQKEYALLARFGFKRKPQEPREGEA